MAYAHYPDHGRAGPPQQTGLSEVIPLRGRPLELGYRDYYDASAEPGVDFWQIMAVLSRRRWLILAVVLAGVLAGALLTLRETPLYRATASIEIQRQESQIIDGANIEPVMVADAEHMATQNALLRSRSLAERVAESLDLPSDPRYADPKLNREQRLAAATDEVQENIIVSPVLRSRVVQITYVSESPGESARIANAVAENFIEANLERKFNATAYARNFLEERLRSTKETLEASERRLVEYARQNNLLDLGEAGAAEVGDSLDATSLVALNAALTEAQNERIAAEHRFIEARTNSSSLETLSSEAIRELKLRRATLLAEYQERAARFKPDYPEMIELRSQMDAVEKEIEDERTSIVTALETDYRAAAAREDSLKQRVGELSDSLQGQRDRRIEYTILRREVDTNRSQYDALLQRLKEVGVAAGAVSSQVAIVDRALPPKTAFSPDLLRTLFLAMALSLAAALALAFALEYVDDTIKTPEDVRSKLALPCIGVVPKIVGEETVADLMADPKSIVAETLYSIRTALEFSTAAGAPRSILVTGNRPAEGKTSSCLGLALSFAGILRRVLIIDADMRRPSFLAREEDSIGLSGLLTRHEPLADHVIRGEIPNLYLLPTGVIPPNPAELLSGPRLREIVAEAEGMFDLVLIDSAPVLSFADAPLLAAACQATVVVVQSGAIRRPLALRTLSRLFESRANVIGVLLSKYDLKQERYGYAYGYGYGYGGGEAGGERVHAEAEARRRIGLFVERGRYVDEDQSAA